MNKDNKKNKGKKSDKKLHISDVMCSENDKPIKLQLMGLYGKIGNRNFRFHYT